VNGFAQAAGVAALADPDHVATSVRRIHSAKAQLLRGLRLLGRRPIGGTANFMLVEVGDAAEVRAQLLRMRLVVRDCTSFGLPRHVRIGVRRVAEQRRLLQALCQVLNQPPAKGTVGKSVQ
jgi:histidinol-phosphate/aromatic aminotransferase/cobyric acid decarboxylase-like protein